MKDVFLLYMVLLLFLSIVTEDPCSENPCEWENTVCVRNETTGFECQCKMGFMGDCSDCTGMLGLEIYLGYIEIFLISTGRVQDGEV